MTKSICFLLVAVMAIVFPQQAKGFEASDFLVEGLEEYEQSFSSYNGTMYAGLLPIDKVDGSNSEPRGKLSFWLFEPEETKDSLTIWLNGGPGCSSYGAGLVLEVSRRKPEFARFHIFTSSAFANALLFFLWIFLFSVRPRHLSPPSCWPRTNKSRSTIVTK